MGGETTDPDITRLTGLAMSLGLGLLVGLQRGWALRDSATGSRFAGIRTFALLGLGGGIAGVLQARAPGPATALLVAACVLVILGYQRTTRQDGSISGTSGVVALLTLASGFLAGSGERLLGTSVAAVMVLLLSMRAQLHHWVRRLDEAEMLAIARFAVIALVVLPLLPDRNFGPYQAWNPRGLWLVVVLVSGFSFAGYFAARMLGPTRAVIATAAAGAMVSSTAVTAALATRMKETAADLPMLAAGIAAASVVMFLRVLALTAMIAPFALPALALVLAPGIAVSLAGCGWYLRKAKLRGSAPAEAQTPGAMAVRNPFDLGPALLLAGLVMGLTILAHWVLDRYGDRSLALVLAVSGTVDVDSAIITLGGLPAGALPAQAAALALAASVTLNTLFKAMVATGAGGWKRGWRGAAPLVGSALAIISCMPLLLARA